MSAKTRYARALNDVAKRYGSMEDDVIERMMSALDDMRARVNDLLLRPGFTAAGLRTYQKNIDRLSEELEARLSSEVRASLAQAYTYGGQGVTEPLSTLGVGQFEFFRPSTSQLNVLLDYSAELVTAISGDVRKAINNQVRLSALGLQSPLDAMRAIDKAIGSPERGRVVQGVSARAESILRTEMQRAYNVATQSVQMQTAERVPGLLKTWIATADNRTRQAHLDAHARYKAEPIPVADPFMLRDPKQGRAELMFPADPSGPAWATINCRCRMATIHPAVGVIGSDLDGRIGAEQKRREEDV